jgi:hypothetical protein
MKANCRSLSARLFTTILLLLVTSPGWSATLSTDDGASQEDLQIESVGANRQDGALVVNGDVTVEVLALVEAGNQSPAILTVAKLKLKVGEVLTREVLASDPEGHQLRLVAVWLPDFAEFWDLGAGAGKLELRPGPADAGHYSLVIVALDDGTPPRSANVVIEVDVPEQMDNEPPGDVTNVRRIDTMH